MTISSNDEFDVPEMRTSRIEVRRFPPDYETPDAVPIREANQILSQRQTGWWYLNSVTSVHLPGESDDRMAASDKFVQEAMKAQAFWFQLLQKAVGKGWRKMRQSVTDEVARDFDYDGVIVAAGLIMGFNRWRRLRESTLKSQIVVQRRPDALNMSGDECFPALQMTQEQEVKRIQNSLATSDEITHFVLPHLTLSSPSNDVFWKCVRSEQAMWNHALRRKLGSEITKSLPSNVQRGQVLDSRMVRTAPWYRRRKGPKKRQNSTQLK